MFVWLRVCECVIVCVVCVLVNVFASVCLCMVSCLFVWLPVGAVSRLRVCLFDRVFEPLRVCGFG